MPRSLRGPGPTRVRSAFLGTISIDVLLHRYIWAVRAFPDELLSARYRAMTAGQPRRNGEVAALSRVCGGGLVYRRWHKDGEREGAASWQGLLAQLGDGS